MAKYFVGDIQGCYEPLLRLLEKVSFNKATDELWLTGDLVARGPHSLETLTFLHSLGPCVKTVLGNHDIHLMSLHAEIKKPNPKDLLSPLLESEHIDTLIHWLRQQPLLRYSKEEQFIISHAGIAPEYTLSTALESAEYTSQALKSSEYKTFLRKMYTSSNVAMPSNKFERFTNAVNNFTRMRYITANRTLDFDCKSQVDEQNMNLTPWFKLLHSDFADYKIIFGHWAALMGKTDTKNVIGLDTGCVWGNVLTMLRLDDMAIFQTK